MYVFHRFSIVAILLLGLIASGFTLTLPHETTTEAMKAGPIWLGQPFPFLAADFSGIDPPPGPWTVSIHPWEMPTRESDLLLLFANVLIFSIPIFFIAMVIELAVRLGKRGTLLDQKA